MADLSKIEVFKLLLGKTTFREVAVAKCGLDEVNVADNQIFNSLYKKLLQKLTQDSVWTHEKTKLGLVLFANDGEDVNNVLSAHSNSYVIEGYIDGGPYDRIRMMSEKDDTKTKTVVGRNKVVTDRYYIYLYMPLNSSIGMLFLERKKGQDIHIPVELFLSEVLKVRNNIKVERYIPQDLINEYRDEGVIDSITFTDYIIPPELYNVDMIEEERGYDVSISIKPKLGVRYDKLGDMLEMVGDVAVMVGEQLKKLSEFGTKKAKIKKERETYSFTIGDDLKIRPSIEVEEAVHDRENDVLYREEAKKVVDTLLEQIRADIYPILPEE